MPLVKQLKSPAGHRYPPLDVPKTISWVRAVWWKGSRRP